MDCQIGRYIPMCLVVNAMELVCLFGYRDNLSLRMAFVALSVHKKTVHWWTVFHASKLQTLRSGISNSEDLGLLDLVPADAVGADLHALHCAVGLDLDVLDVGLEGPRRDLDDVHSYAALLLRQAPANYRGATEFLLPADFTYVAH